MKKLYLLFYFATTLFCLTVQIKVDGQSILYQGYPSTVTNVNLIDMSSTSNGIFGNFLGLKADGTVVSWGDNTYGQSNVPSGLSNIIALGAGYFHSLALKTDGSVVAWGDNTYGQLNVPIGLNNVVAISAGFYHSLALKTDGSVVAWGDNTYGQLNVPTGLNNVVAISAGSGHSMALLDNGKAVGWGYAGELNIPSTLSGVVKISALGGINMFLKDDGNVEVSGATTWGEANIPSDLSNVQDIAAGQGNMTVLLSDGTVRTWGNYASNWTGYNNIDLITSNFIYRNANVQIQNQPEPFFLTDQSSISFYMSTFVNNNPQNPMFYSYQWFKRGVPDTLNEYDWNNGQLPLPTTATGSYFCKITNQSTGDFINSRTVYIGIKLFKNQPVSQLKCQNESVTLSVGIALPNHSYQWYRKGMTQPDIPILNANSNDYIIPTFQVSDVGDYYCVVSFSGRIEASNVATLSINNFTDFSILAQPTPQTVIQGSSATFNINATNSGPIVFQWYKVGTPDVMINGATSNTLSIYSTKLTDAGLYYCKIGNGCSSSSITSNTAKLDVLSGPLAVLVQPLPQIVCKGNSATFSATFSPVTNISYVQWFKRGVDGAGVRMNLGRSQIFTITSCGLNDAGVYYLQASDGVNFVTSNDVTLTVNDLPKAPVLYASSSGYCVGSSPPVFSVSNSNSAAGNWSFTYQIGTSGTPIATANISGATATFVATDLSGTNNYNVTVTDWNGCKASNTIAITRNELIPMLLLADKQAYCTGSQVPLISIVLLNNYYSYFYSITYSINNANQKALGATNINYYPLNATDLSGTNNYNVTVTDWNGCKASRTIAITRNELPTTAVLTSDKTSYCTGSTLPILSVSSSNSAAGNWSLVYATSALNQTAVTGITGATKSFNATDLSGTNNYKIVSITDANGCTNNTPSNVIGIARNELPTTAVLFSDRTSYCTGSTLPIVSVSNSNSAAGNWSLVYAIGAVSQPAVTGITGATKSFNATDLSGINNYKILSITDAIGCTNNTPSNMIGITRNELPTTAVLSYDKTSYCTGSTLPVLSVGNSNSAAGNWSMVYTIGAVSQPAVTGITGATKSFNATDLAGSNNYKILSITDGKGCTNALASNTIVITRNELPTTAVLTSNKTSYCTGSTLPVLSVSNNNSAAGNWSLVYAIGAVSQPAVTGISGATKSFNAADLAGANNYKILSITDANGCTNALASNIIAITRNELPTTAVLTSDKTSYCTGSTLPILSVSNSNSAAGNWSMVYAIGAVSQPAVTGITGATKSFSATDLAGANNYKILSIADANGCTNALASNTIAITRNELPVAVLSSDKTSYCTGSTLPILSVSNSNSAAGNWSMVYAIGAVSQPAVTGITGAMKSFNATDLAGTNSYKILSITDAIGCTNAVASNTINLIRNELPTASIASSNSSYCAGSTPINISLNTIGLAPITVTYKEGTTVKTTSVASITPNPTGTYSYTLVSVQDNSSCNQAASGAVNVTQNMLPTASITSPNSSYCAGSTPANISISTTGASPFTVNYNEGATGKITASSATPFITPISSGSQTYTLTSVKDANNCINSALTGSISVNVTQNALPTANINGNFRYCAGSNPGNISIATTGASPFTVYYNEGSTGKITASSANPLITVSSSGSQTYTLTSVKDANNCINSALTGYVTANVTQIAMPPMPSLTANQTFYCASSSSLPTFTATNSNGDFWSMIYSVNGTPQPSTGVHTIATTTFQPTSQAINMTGVNTFKIESITDAFTGCVNSSPGTPVYIYRIDPPVITSQSPGGIFCGPTINQTLNVVASGNGQISYQWAKNGVNLLGATSSSYFTGTVNTSNTYSCQVTDNCGATVTASIPLIIVTNAPTTPKNLTASQFIGCTAFTLGWMPSGSNPASYLLDLSSSSSFSSYVSGYQAISVASNSLPVTGFTFSAPVYYFRVRSNNACGISSYSPIQSFPKPTGCAREEAELEVLDNIYPNPASSVVNIVGHSAKFTIKIYNSIGLEVLSKVSDFIETQINVSGFETGFYLIKMIAKDQTLTYKKIEIIK